MSGPAGLLLAAGAGRRMGRPKSQLRERDGGAFLDRAVRVLLDGGCARVTVVLGAEPATAGEILAESGWDADARVDVTVAADWEQGMGASLRHGLAALQPGPRCAVVTLVDLPDVTAAVVGRVLGSGADAGTLARAAYAGRPGHPVVLGASHWSPIATAARGDRGARDYLAAHRVTLVECGDLATGRDVDRPEDLA